MFAVQRCNNYRTSAAMLCAAASIAGMTGCSAMPKFGRQDVSQTVPVAGEQAPYFVEMHPNFGKAKLYKGQITKPTTVQEALEVSGANSEIKSMIVDVHRRLPDGGMLKLPVEFDKGKQVRVDQDYALHPNDRIVVRAKSNSPLDKLVDQVFGEL